MSLKNNKLSIASILFLFLITAIPSVLAVTGVKQTDIFYDGSTLEPVTGVQEILYTCDSSECSSQGDLILDENTGNSNQLTFEYPYNPSSTESNPDYYSHFSFKECYLPKEYVEWVWGHGTEVEYDYHFNKAESCKSPIDSFSVTNKNYVNEPVVINTEVLLGADAHSAFTDLQLDWFPSGYEDYYSVETKATLNIYNENNDVVYTKTRNLNILMDTSEEVEFEWTPQEQGNYTAKISTDVTDCQCESSVKQYSERQFRVWEERPQDECYTMINNLEAVPEFGKEGEETTINFTKISNYADENYDKTPIQTDIEYEITKNNQVVYKNDTLLPANDNTEDPEEYSFDWTPSEGGDYTIKVEGKGNESVCQGKTNPLDTASLGYSVDAEEKYNLEFIVKDSETSDVLNNAEVHVNGQSGTTNSAGKVNFNLNKGDYSWNFSKSDYYSKSGSVNLNENKTINVDLEPKEQPPEEHKVTFVVKDSETSSVITNAKVQFDGQTKDTNSQGKAIFEVEEGNYNWSVSKEDFQDETGSVYVDEDKTINVELEPEEQEPETYNVEFYVEECDCHNQIKDALVEINNESGYTDVNGEIEFELEEGEYNWIVSKQGFQSETGNVYINEDKRIEVCLDPKEENETEKYNLDFIVKEQGSNDTLDNANVSINGQSGTTNSQGKVVFELEEGNYSWNVSKSDYYSKSGSVNLNENKTINVELEKKSEEPEIYDIEFIVKDSETSDLLNNAKVQFDGETKYTNSNGKAMFKVEEGTYSWNVSKTDYYSKSENVYVDENKTINVNLEDDDKDDDKESCCSTTEFEESCTPVWDCTSWSECNNGFRTRECTDINNCDRWEVESSSKPLERQACTDSITDNSLIEEKEQKNYLGGLLLGILIFLLLILFSLLLKARR